MHKELRIIYMGTPDFAVPSLDILVANGYQVVAVITAPDKPKGRGQKLSYSPVKEAALKHNIPVLQPTNLKSPEFLEELASYKANLQIVVAFRMLPEAVWNMPEIGTFNLHASLLPQYRGAAPINWAIINGEQETGLTTFFLKHEIDTGNILFQEKESILENDDAGSLYQRLMIKGADLVLKTVQAIEKGDFHPQAQDENQEIKHAPKIFKETCEINWDQEVDKVHNFIRGLSPYPAAWTKLNDLNFKIFKTEKAIGPKEIYAPGEYVTDNKSFILVKTSDRWLSILELQAEGKRRMTVEEFLRGNQL